METFRKRIEPLIAEMRSVKRTTKENIEFMKANRSGDYLIKVNKSSPIYLGGSEQYIAFTYCADGWFSASSRAKAMWFTGQEVHEFTKNRKGFHVVKR